MPMMHVGVMGVGVARPLMAMPVGMRFRHQPVVTMRMMLIVDVAVLVLQRFVLVLVRMSLR